MGEYQGWHLLTDSHTVMGEYPARDNTYWQTASQWWVSTLAGITLTDRQSHSDGWVPGLTLTDRQSHSDGWVKGLTLTDRQSHSDGWVKGLTLTDSHTVMGEYQGWHLLTDSHTVMGEYQGWHLLTDSHTVMGEYQGWHLLTDSLTVMVSISPGITLMDRQPHSDGEYPTRDYTYWQTASQWWVSILPGVTLTDRQSHSDGWVSHQGLHLLTDSFAVMGEYPTRGYTYWQTVTQWWVSIPPGVTLTDRQPRSASHTFSRRLHTRVGRCGNTDIRVPQMYCHLSIKTLSWGAYPGFPNNGANILFG